MIIIIIMGGGIVILPIPSRGVGNGVGTITKTR